MPRLRICSLVAVAAAVSSVLVACAPSTPPPPVPSTTNAPPPTYPLPPDCALHAPSSSEMAPDRVAVTAGETVTFTVDDAPSSVVAFTWRPSTNHGPVTEVTSTEPQFTYTTSTPGVLTVSVSMTWTSCSLPSPTRFRSSSIDVLPSARELAEAEVALAGMINTLRTDYTQPPSPMLSVNAALTTGSRAWSHTRLTDPGAPAHDPVFLADVGPGHPWWVVRENVFLISCPSVACSSATSMATAAHQAFVNSPGHLANMVAGDVTFMGVGFAVHDRPGSGYDVAVTERFAS